jgi:hypothetical protein
MILTEKQRAALAAGRNVFSAINQPKKRGRLPSKLKKFVKDNAISKDDMEKVFKNLIFGKTIKELQDMIIPGKKENLPVIVVLLISAFIQDMKSGTLKEVNTVLDRVFGKPSQSVDLKNNMNISPETLESLNAIFHEREEKEKKPRRKSAKVKK